MQAPAQTKDRIQHRTRCPGQESTGIHGCGTGRRAAPSQKSHPITLVIDYAACCLVRRGDVNCPDRLLLRASGSTTSQQSAGRFVELGFQKELCERWVSLVSAAVVQAYLRVARQFQFAGLAAMIDKRQRAPLRIDVRHDADAATRFDVAAQTTEFGAVGVKLEFMLISGPAKWLIANGPDFVFSQVTDVIKLAPAIAGHIFAPAGDIQAPPGADSGPSRRDDDPVLAV